MMLFDIKHKDTGYSKTTFCQVQNANSGMFWQVEAEKPKML